MPWLPSRVRPCRDHQCHASKGFAVDFWAAIVKEKPPFTLWWTNIAMENGHLWWVFPLKMVDLSIAMLNYQRVLVLCTVSTHTDWIQTPPCRASNLLLWLETCGTTLGVSQTLELRNHGLTAASPVLYPLIWRFPKWGIPETLGFNTNDLGVQRNR